MRPFPASAEELLAELEKIIPEPAPYPGDARDHTMYHAGRRSVIHEIREWRRNAVAGPLKEKRGGGRVVKGS